MAHTTKARLVLDLEYRGKEKDFRKLFDPVRYKYLGSLINKINVTTESVEVIKHDPIPNPKRRKLNFRKNTLKKILELAGFEIPKSRKKYHEQCAQTSKEWRYRSYRNENYDYAELSKETKLANLTGTARSSTILDHKADPIEILADLKIYRTYKHVHVEYFLDSSNYAKYGLETINRLTSHQIGMTFNDPYMKLWVFGDSNPTQFDMRTWIPKLTETVDSHDPNSFQQLANVISKITKDPYGN